MQNNAGFIKTTKTQKPQAKPQHVQGKATRGKKWERQGKRDLWN